MKQVRSSLINNFFFVLKISNYIHANFIHVTHQVLDVYGVNWSVQVHMLVVLVPILLSTWIRNLKYLVPVSSIANILIISGYLLTVFLMSHDLPPISERKYVADWQNLPLFFGTVIYSFEGITLVNY